MGETYEQFVEKFKPKKTTDDCYTPPAVYDAVCSWVEKEYGVERGSFVRPFFPGGDYENYDYPEGCIVVDNPPFSILAKILRFYIGRGIRFFLFAPTLTLFTGAATVLGLQFICCHIQVTYCNGAVVNTSFVTNLEPGGIRTAPDLNRLVTNANVSETSPKNELPKYKYPANVINPASVGWVAERGIDFRIPAAECRFIRSLASQREYKKTIFGGGFLISDRAAREWKEARKAAEEARKVADDKRTVTWSLSDEERRIIDGLNRAADERGKEGNGC